MFKKFFSNTRKPEGIGGKIMLSMMNKGHDKVSNWGFSHISAESNMKILDIGCGGGLNIKKWLQLSKDSKVIGFDYSPESVQKSLKMNKKAVEEGRCEVIEGSVINLPFKENEFDFVSAFETVYFWPNIIDSFENVKRVLKPGGKFMIVNEASLLDKRSKKWEGIIDGMIVYSEKNLISFLEEAGFKINVSETKGKLGWLTIIAEKNIK